MHQYLPLLALLPAGALAVADAAIEARITPAPVLAKRQNPAACVTAGGFLQICESLTNGFDDLPVTRQASCLCYSSASWIPSLFDGQINSCAAQASSAGLTSVASLARSFTSLCSRAGNVRSVSAGAVTPSSPTPTSGTASRATITGGAEPACTLVASAVSICRSLTPGFANADISTQARCLCYSSATWRPTLFDGAVTSCASQASSAGDSSYYSIVTALSGFCASAGDVTTRTGATTRATAVQTAIASNTRAGIVPVGGSSVATSLGGASASTAVTSAAVARTTTITGGAPAATFLPAAQVVLAAGAAAVAGML